MSLTISRFRVTFFRQALALRRTRDLGAEAAACRFPRLREIWYR
jgi:hypothetical protein